MTALRDALSHAKNALRQLRAVRATETTRPGSPAPDRALAASLLRRALHELTSAAEAVRSELGDPAVLLEAQVEQPEEPGDRMTALQKAQFGIPTLEPSSLDKGRSFAPLSPPRVPGRSDAQVMRRPLGSRWDPLTMTHTTSPLRGLSENDLRAPRSPSERDKAELPRP